MSKQPIIELKNIAIDFDGKTLLEGFNLSVSKGEHIALMGASGCGKSSLLAAILHIIPISKGEIYYKGNPLSNNTLPNIYKEVTWMPQHLDFSYETTEEIFTTLFALGANSYLQYSRPKAIEMLQALKLGEETLTKSPRELSGGEKQRVLLAANLMMQRKVLLLDEPTSALDSASRTKVIELLRALKNTTVIVVTHDKEVAAAMERTINICEPR